jgi:tetratricopeptide (TPR) repeat protein
VGRSLDNLGLVLRRLGDLDAADDAHQRALAIRQIQLGADHPHVAHALSSLGNVAYERGDLPAARTFYEQALRILEARLGSDHADVASNLANLGNVLWGLGDLPAARAVFERARLSFRAQLGPDHPDMAQTQQSLQILLSELAEAPPSRTPHQQLLPVFEPRMGSGTQLATPTPGSPLRTPPTLGQVPRAFHQRQLTQLPTALPCRSPTAATVGAGLSYASRIYETPRRLSGQWAMTCPAVVGWQPGLDVARWFRRRGWCELCAHMPWCAPSPRGNPCAELPARP